MTEPISTSYATGTTLTLFLISLVPGIDATIVLGAFSGAVVFAMTSDDLSTLKKIIFLFVSFTGGCLCARMATDGLAYMLPASIAPNAGVGALLSAAVIVKLLLYAIRVAGDPGKVLGGLFKKGEH